MDSACALVTFGQGIAPVSRVLGVSRAQLTLRMKASDNKPDKRRQRRDEAADAEVLSRILDIIGDMPAYGYRRVWAILRRQSRNEGLPFVNAKRVYRIMSENSLLLLHDKPYGAPEKPEPEKQCRTTISLGESMLVTIEDLALRNKRNGKDPKNVSAIVRVALEQYLKTLT